MEATLSPEIVKTIGVNLEKKCHLLILSTPPGTRVVSTITVICLEKNALNLLRIKTISSDSKASLCFYVVL